MSGIFTVSDKKVVPCETTITGNMLAKSGPLFRTAGFPGPCVFVSALPLVRPLAGNFSFFVAIFSTAGMGNGRFGMLPEKMTL
jgi:hypothetical protein